MRHINFFATFAGLFCWTVAALAADPSAIEPGAGSGTVILDNDSLLRVYFAHRPPQTISPAGELAPLAAVKEDFASPPPPADWTSPDFADITWQRSRSPVETDQPTSYTFGNLVSWYAQTSTSLICLRGKFMVADPAATKGLKLSLVYVGGVVVYLNGREVTRANLPAGQLTPDTPAEKYPDDLYCLASGAFLQDISKEQANFDRRYRKLTDIQVPADLLRKGINVLAVEIHRAPINEAAAKARRSAVGGMSVTPGIWAYAELRDIRLAATGAGVAPNVARPTGIQLWTCQPYDTVTAFDYGDPGSVSPISLTGARNGVLSGRLVVSSDQPIRGLKISVSPLKQSGGTAILASAASVRVAEASVPGKTLSPAMRYDMLSPVVPATVTVNKAPLPRETYLSNGASAGLRIERKSVTAGAIAPIWVTVRVPGNAAPGAYEAAVTVSADGLEPTAVPLRLEVLSLTLPDADRLRVRHLSFPSPESLAAHYNVPLWSDRHFELMGKSMELMRQINARQVLIDVALDFYGIGGNKDSMIRWIPQPDGSFNYDFTAFDKYLDLVAAKLGKPNPLRLNCWGEVRPGWGSGGGKEDPAGKKVCQLDPATGKTSPMTQPELGTDASMKFWQPMLAEVRKKVEARGWSDVTVFGHNSYNAPAWPPIVTVARQIWPDGAWGYTAHNGTLNANWPTADKKETMPVRYSECVWTRGKLSPRGFVPLLTDRASMWCWSFRGVLRDWSPLADLRAAPAAAILRSHDGIGQLGIDIFPIKSERGRGAYLNTDRGGLGPSCSTMAILAPGPDGPLATERLEMLREGMQLAEAMLILGRAEQSGKLAAALAGRVKACLDEHATAYIWQWPSGRAERDAVLLATAAEVSASEGGD